MLRAVGKIQLTRNHAGVVDSVSRAARGAERTKIRQGTSRTPYDCVIEPVRRRRLADDLAGGVDRDLVRKRAVERAQILSRSGRRIRRRGRPEQRAVADVSPLIGSGDSSVRRNRPPNGARTSVRRIQNDHLAVRHPKRGRRRPGLIEQCPDDLVRIADAQGNARQSAGVEDSDRAGRAVRDVRLPDERMVGVGRCDSHNFSRIADAERSDGPGGHAGENAQVSPRAGCRVRRAWRP